jgi:hypothetical protein
MPLQFSHFGDMPLQKSNLEICHYKSLIPLTMPFCFQYQFIYSSYTIVVVHIHMYSHTDTKKEEKGNRMYLHQKLVKLTPSSGTPWIKQVPAMSSKVLAQGRACSSDRASYSGRRISRAPPSCGLLRPPCHASSSGWCIPQGRVPGFQQPSRPLAASASWSRRSPRYPTPP